MIPLLHDFTDVPVLVFGGGRVGARKARRFAREADVTVVSPEFADEPFAPDEADDAESTAGNVDFVRAEPDSDAVAEWIDRLEPALVVAATDDETVNEAAVETARERGILVNRADRAGERDPGSVVVPATVRDEQVVVSISTGATAPALSKHLRRELEDTLEGASEMATVLAAVRTELKRRGVPANRRRTIVSDVVSDSATWTALRTGNSNTSQVIEDVLDDERSRGGDPR
ncbi:precorrin-2 dehydrogenase/sirohydrochlorin ferrochelatase family protein [Halostagnicola kamekurae]|uniref:precorrin-2 dehydrogenase n=1 Tax=Halostagnicola kamekurae TaxID=619731 RepID=A0A1I6PX02_9EURY|nr:bifunctional precorrin-2 dehydrogenase/sirohydrochlorin ferrochelatase [Halostagnicola kamekurae]SFS44709.1 precorrin-2 dehydrogenase / sirohydrochlorin ferrochelatase [Halostagnicola kamekurae]